MNRRSLVVVGLLVALTLAGVVSYFASSSPDGLNKVASDTGFDKSAKEHDLDGSPFGGYETKGVGDGFLSGGVAGVAGVGVTFLLVGGVVWAVRRRSSSPAAGDGEAVDGDVAEDDLAEEPVRR